MTRSGRDPVAPSGDTARMTEPPSAAAVEMSAEDAAAVRAIERPAPALMTLYVLTALMSLCLFPIVIVPMYFRYHTLRYRIDDEGTILDAKTGEVKDVIPGRPADAAGLGPGMEIVAVNGRRFTTEWLRTVLAAKRPLDLLVRNGEEMAAYRLARISR